MFPKRKFAAVALCKECNKTFVNKSNLRKHIKTKHSGKLQERLKDLLLKCYYL